MPSPLSSYDIIVIGGGPAGMFCAITAAAGKPSFRVLLLDANMKLGRKLSATGNGRCNLTNAAISRDRYHGANPDFANGVLGRFGSADLLGWFNERGVEFREEADGRFFPVTDQAVTIVDNMKEELEARNVEVVLNTRVASLSRAGSGGFRVEAASGGPWESRKLVIATGGPAYPRLGATRDGNMFAANFGHAVSEPRPTLTGFESTEKALFDLQGVQTLCEASLTLADRRVRTVTGEVMFTHYGISGPAIFDLSPFISREDPSQTQAAVVLNFFPGLSADAVEEKIIAIWESNPSRQAANTLIGLLPKKLTQVLMRNVVRMDISLPVSSVTKETRKNLVRTLTSLKIGLKALRGFEEAQAASGGIMTDAVDPRTMESKLVPGLYFCGEALDIDGDCGGFNLQFAFSSGRAAGLAAAGL